MLLPHALLALATIPLVPGGAPHLENDAPVSLQDEAKAPWSPTPSATRIAFRVVFPESTPRDEVATLVVEATDPARVKDWIWTAAEGPDYRTVDSTPVTDGQVVRLRMPVAAEEVRARLDAKYMTRATVGLDGVEPGRPAIVLRPAPASRVRVEITAAGPGVTDLAALVGESFVVVDEDGGVPGRARDRTETLLVGAALEAELVGIPHGHTLTLATRRYARAPGAPFQLVGLPHRVSEQPDQIWQLQAVPLATIAGRVETAAGTPIDGARVMIGEGVAAARTGADGRFRLAVSPQVVQGASLSVAAPAHASTIAELDSPLVTDHALDLGHAAHAPP